MGVLARDPGMVVIIANNAPKSSASWKVLRWFQVWWWGLGRGLTGPGRCFPAGAFNQAELLLSQWRSGPRHLNSDKI